MSKLIPRHQKGKSVKYFGAYNPKQQAYVLPVYKKEGVVLPEITITPKNNTNLGEYMQNRDFGFGKEIISYTPAGDVMDATQIYKDTKQGNYGQAALGAGLFFLPDILAKPIKKGLKKLNIIKPKNIDQISQLDWSPQSWFGDAGKRTKWTEDEKILQSHVPEYLNIERESKENGTWLKMQNGDIWKGPFRNITKLKPTKLTKEQTTYKIPIEEAKNYMKEWDYQIQTDLLPFDYMSPQEIENAIKEIKTKVGNYINNLPLEQIEPHRIKHYSNEQLLKKYGLFER